ncbi:MAG: hypothetical protein B6244_08445 [Candidatus Cloacimonetes bacterium 4572_55]|nr:MAG: hypothetical protein B6244_08445 [Candidatus Cloacimonetes bacterium 4572_55]
MLKKLSLAIIMLLLCASSSHAQMGAYQIVKINDPALVRQVVVQRNFQKIEIKSTNELSQLLFPGDVVKLLNDQIEVTLRTPQNDAVHLAGKQEVRLPAESGTWFNIKDATYQVTHPVKTELLGLTITANQAKYNVSVNDEDEVVVQVMSGDVAVCSYYHGLITKKISAGQSTLILPGQAIPDPRSTKLTAHQTRRFDSADLASVSSVVPMTPVQKPRSQFKGVNEPIAVVPASQKQKEGSIVKPQSNIAQVNQPNRTTDPLKRMNIPKVSGPSSKSWFSRMVGSKWFLAGGGLVTSGVVIAIFRPDPTPSTSSLSELPAPPIPQNP